MYTYIYIYMCSGCCLLATMDPYLLWSHLIQHPHHPTRLVSTLIACLLITRASQMLCLCKLPDKRRLLSEICWYLTP